MSYLTAGSLRVTDSQKDRIFKGSSRPGQLSSAADQPRTLLVACKLVVGHRRLTGADDSEGVGLLVALPSEDPEDRDELWTVSNFDGKSVKMAFEVPTDPRNPSSCAYPSRPR